MALDDAGKCTYCSRDQDKINTTSRLAALSIKVGDTERGEDLFRQVLKSAGDDVHYLTMIAGNSHRLKVKPEQAMVWIEKAVALVKPDDRVSGMTYNLYANMLFDNGDVKKAVEFGTKAYELSPHFKLKADLEKFQAAVE